MGYWIICMTHFFLLEQGVLMAPLAFDDIMFYCEHIARALLAPNRF